ncbi:MAG: JAB domain-containing protein [Verrucomicrobiota bacterium]|jgi:hypothetical protein
MKGLLKIHASLRLPAKWLAAAGLQAGDQVDVAVLSPGVIELRRHGAPGCPDFHIAADRLDHAIAKADAAAHALHDSVQLPLNPFEIRALEAPRRHRKRAVPMEFKVVCLRECPTLNAVLDRPEEIRAYYAEHIVAHPYFDPCVETFYVLCLNTRRRLIGHKLISHGTLDTILVHPREVFKPAIAANAAAVVLAHNHPSGDPSPSDADIKVTRDLIRAGQLLKIEVLDHVIIGRPAPYRLKDYCSLREMGYCAV